MLPTPEVRARVLSGSEVEFNILATTEACTTTVYYQAVGSTQQQTGPSRNGSGAVTLGGLSEGNSYLFFVISTLNTDFSLPSVIHVNLVQGELTLTGAIHNRWNQDLALSQAVVGGLWTGEVPEGTAQPYTWLEVPRVMGRPYFADRFDRCIVLFHTYAVGAALAETCAQLIRDRFDEKPLSFNSNITKAVYMLERMYRLVCEGTRSRDNQLVFRTIQTYEIYTQKPRGG
jgi:hypothetical protein